MGSLLDDIQNRNASKSGTACRTGELLKNPDIGPDLWEALAAHPAVTYELIATVLQERGHDVRAASLSYHNRGKCGCNG